MPDPTISASVGEGGKNRKADVIVVQTLLKQLNDHPVEVSGVCDDATIAAIRAFQAGLFGNPDGLVEPGLTTLRQLGKITNLGFVLLPQVEGDGLYSYSHKAEQYGSPTLIRVLQEVANQFHVAHPELLVGVGDISFRDGALMPPHKSHRNGRQADIRPLRKDGAKLPVTFKDPIYDREATRALVEMLLGQAPVKKIFFNDPKIAGVAPLPGHDNHLHIETKA